MPNSAVRRVALQLVTILLLCASCTTAGEPPELIGGSPAPGREEARAPLASPGRRDAQTLRDCIAALPAGTTLPGEGARISPGATIEADDFFFDPTCVLDGQPGDAIAVTVRNEGRLLHNIEIEELGIDRDVRPGETVTVEVTMSERPLLYVCKYHLESGMVGVLLPVEGDPSAP